MGIIYLLSDDSTVICQHMWVLLHTNIKQIAVDGKSSARCIKVFTTEPRATKSDSVKMQTFYTFSLIWDVIHWVDLSVYFGAKKTKLIMLTAQCRYISSKLK